MKLKALKKILDKMSKEQLNKDLVVVACEMTQSGNGVARKAKGRLLYSGEDDPCELRSFSDLKEEFGKEEAEEMEVVLNKGDFYIELP